MRQWWDRVFFRPESTATLAVMRIAFGLLMLGWTLSLTPDVTAFFGEDAVAPFGSTANGRWTLLEWWGTDTAATTLHVAMLVAAVAFIVGFHTRLAGLVLFVAYLSFTRRNPWVVNSGDLLLRHLALFLTLAPSGAALSYDAWRRTGRVWTFPHRAPWGRRLLQVQLSIVYLSTVIAKAPGSTWHDGTAVGYALRIEDLIRFGVPDAAFDSLLFVNLMTYGTLVAEVALGVLIWNRALRPYVLAVGVLLHLSIDLTLTVGFFSYGMLVTYLSFVEPGTMERLLDRARHRFGRAVPEPDEDRSTVTVGARP